MVEMEGSKEILRYECLRNIGVKTQKLGALVKKMFDTLCEIGPFIP